MTVLSDERLREICADPSIECDVPFAYAREVERAVVSDLAARGGVDVSELAERAYRTSKSYYAAPAIERIADALRLALAQQAAQHEAREAKWSRLVMLLDDYAHDHARLDKYDMDVMRELRRELGVE